MILKEYIRLKGQFVKNDDGAVTIDWVVIAAIVIGFAFSMGVAIKPAMDSAGSNVAASIPTN